MRGRQDELKRIRHRIGHMRRPHSDDLSRLEQTLRDLERGAFIALASYNRRIEPDPDKHDAVTDGWVVGTHPDAQRLTRHAIGHAFDAVLMVSRQADPHELGWNRWRKRATGLDFRLLSDTGWNVVDETTVPISVFGAGGSVEAAPSR